MDKIVFYKERDFGEKFNVTFEFVKQNWKILLRYALYGILPLAFVGALSLNSLMQSMVDVSSGNSMFDDELSYTMLFSYALLLPTSLAAYIWIGTVVFSMMQFYNAHDEGLQGVTFQELKPSFRRNAWRLFKCGLVGFLIGIVFLAVFFTVIALGAAINSGAMTAIFCFLAVAAVVAFGVPLILVTPTYIFEDISVWHAYVRGFRLGWSTWGGIFGLGFVLSLLSNVVSVVFVMPWEVCVFVKTLFVQAYAGEETFVGSVAFVILQYIFGVVMWIGSYLIYNLFFISTGYLYSHAAEKLDDMSVGQGIDDFEEMADKSQDDDDLFKV
ncbi:MAG: hypothetical protein KIG93_02775 [Prevotella sp.]|nr:hypothetical protein [Prevotella sp.]